jgi:hypothetical protein
MAPPGAPNGMSGEKIRDKQRNFLLDLIERKYVKEDQMGKLDLIMKCLRISEDPEEYGMSKDKASELITWFLKQPDKPREHSVKVDLFDDVPAGRYCVPAENGELRFYQVWRPKDNLNVFRVYVMFGPHQGAVHRGAVNGIMRKIQADPREAAIRFGMEIGACSNCGRRLTNHISRALGIGPVCGGRMFGDDFKPMVGAARADLLARGIDPEEEIDDDAV